LFSVASIPIRDVERPSAVSVLRYVAEIKDPVHGYIYLTEVEKALVDTPPLQRLHRVKQLAGANLTYPGAEHTRFLHSIGSMHLAGLLARRLLDLGYMKEDDVQKVRMAVLLHDVGHGPFSHTFEEVLDKYRGMTHEDVAGWLIRKSVLADVIKDGGYSAKEISQLAVGRLEKTSKRYLNYLVAGHFAPEILDYLVRDSYFSGVEYGRIDAHRLINSLDVVDDVLAIEYPGAFHVLEFFIIARLEMFNAVYFHRTVRAANVMLARAMDLANRRLKLTSFKTVEDFISLDDLKVLLDLLSLGKSRERALSVAYNLTKMFVERTLLKCTYELHVHQRDEFFSNILSKDKIRSQIEEEIGEKACVDPNYVAIDVPTVRSVPVHPMEEKPGEILVFRKAAGKKAVEKLTEVSPMMATLAKFVDIVRVYTLPQHREKVELACEDVLGKKTFATRISF